MKILFLLLYLMSLGFYLENCVNFFYFLMILMSFLSMNYMNLNEMLNWFSLNLIFLTLLISIFMLYSSLNFIWMKKFFNYYYFLMCLMAIMLVMSFLVGNFLLFYIFFELSMIPIFVMILGWGFNMERLQASVYMFMYTFFFSVPFFLFLMIYFYDNIYYSNFLIKLEWNVKQNLLLIIMFFMIFFVKFPMYMIHLWLPKAHVEAPVAGSMILAGVLLKLGGYGILTFMNMIFYSTYFLWEILFVLGVLGGLIMMFVCYRQIDLKCFIAYSSVAHMGMVVSSFMIFSQLSVWGGFLMLLGHGLVSSGLFYGMNLFYERFYSRSIMILKGNLLNLPLIGIWWFLLNFVNMSGPPSMNFFSEMMIFFSLANVNIISMVILSLLLLWGGIFSIFLFISLLHGKSGFFYPMKMLYVRENLIFLVHLLPAFMFLMFL